MLLLRFKKKKKRPVLTIVIFFMQHDSWKFLAKNISTALTQPVEAIFNMTFIAPALVSCPLSQIMVLRRLSQNFY